MKLITICSDSHDELLKKHLLPSIPSTLTPVITRTIQRGNGNHGWHPEFIEAMREKLSIVLHYTKTETAPFLYCDADIRFNPLLNPVPFLLKTLEENKFDIICQRDGGDICAGFMLLAPSKKNSDYLQAVLNYMNTNLSKCDQLAFKELYHSNLYPNDAKPHIGLLDINVGFGNYNHLQPNVLWTPENNMMEKYKDIIKKQFIWHANHTIGVENKVQMLDRFKILSSN